MLKKSTFVTVSLLSLFLSGCSVDQRYKREVNDNDSYLNTPVLKPLAVPSNMRLPAEVGDYYIYPAANTEGPVGMDVDVRAPSQPIATLIGSYAQYSRNVAVMDAPNERPLWSEVAASLAANNVTLVEKNAQEMRTAPVTFTRSDEVNPFQATYLIRYHSNGFRQYVSVELLTLVSNGNELTQNAIERQRYTVDFFNMIMLDVKKRELAQFNHVESD